MTMHLPFSSLPSLCIYNGIMSEIEREGRERGVRETERQRDRERQIRDRETETRRERVWVGFNFLYVINIIGKYNWSSCFQDFY